MNLYFHIEINWLQRTMWLLLGQLPMSFKRVGKPDLLLLKRHLSRENRNGHLQKWVRGFLPRKFKVGIPAPETTKDQERAASRSSALESPMVRTVTPILICGPRSQARASSEVRRTSSRPRLHRTLWEEDSCLTERLDGLNSTTLILAQSQWRYGAWIRVGDGRSQRGASSDLLQTHIPAYSAAATFLERGDGAQFHTVGLYVVRLFAPHPKSRSVVCAQSWKPAWALPAPPAIWDVSCGTNIIPPLLSVITWAGLALGIQPRDFGLARAL